MVKQLFITFVTVFGFLSVHGQTKPNIVFILADDLGWADLACYGSRFHQTPHLDRMAREGMRFTDAYAAAPVCSPTRAAFLTGKAPARLHLTDYIPGKPNTPDRKLLRGAFEQQLSIEERTIAERLKEEGYTTGLIGKWHLGGKGFEAEKQGFDVVLAASSTGTPGSYFSPFTQKGRQVPLPPGPDGEYLTDRLTDEALVFIERHKDKPFFLYLPHYAVHVPLQGKTNLTEKYEKLIEHSNEQTNAVYAGMIDSLDQSVGRVLDKLDALNLSENTIVVFTSDNGGLVSPRVTSNAPLRTGKGNVYEGGIRVPLIVKWKNKIKAGTTTAVPVITTDFYPTFVELATKASPSDATDGISLVPLLNGGTLPARNLFWHYPHYSPQGGAPGGAIRSGSYKLVQTFEDGGLELYNLANDIGETNNLAEVENAKTVELNAALEKWRREVGAEMMLPNPDFQPGSERQK